MEEKMTKKKSINPVPLVITGMLITALLLLLSIISLIEVMYSFRTKSGSSQPMELHISVCRLVIFLLLEYFFLSSSAYLYPLIHSRFFLIIRESPQLVYRLTFWLITLLPLHVILFITSLCYTFLKSVENMKKCSINIFLY